jgi:hypothetical protein
MTKTPDDPGGFILLLTARTVAFDLLLRALYAAEAIKHRDPENFIRTAIETIIGSMDAVKHHPADEAEAYVWEAAERELRSFLESVALRVREQDP